VEGAKRGKRLLHSGRVSPPTPTPSPSSRSSALAGLLSFLWPGLGQWYAGRRRDALVYALPVIGLAAVFALQATSGVAVLAVRLLDPSYSLTLVVVVAILAVWRLMAIADAALSPRWRIALGGSAGRAVILLGALVIAMHAVVGYYTWSFYEASTQIFVGANDDGPAPGPSAPYVPRSTDDFDVAPFATPPPTSPSRITILFTGIDKNTERDHSLTDTLLVVSVNPATGATAMVSFPRDLAGFPMYGGGTYEGKINSLMSYAASHRGTYPDGPLPTLVHELSYLLGVPINYYAAIDLDGFQQMIDAVGGVTVTLDKPLDDTFYNWLDGSPRGLFLSAGSHLLDGRTALAYVRSRYADSDFARAARQQQLLLALEQKLANPAMLPKLPAVLRVAANTVRTNVPADHLQEILQLTQGLDPSKIDKVVLQPPKFAVHPPNDSTGGTYLLRLRWGAVQNLSVRLFGEASAFWSASAGASPLPSP
jgi:polyisoprenyl-teichoic acid--peptidoglycan teichoic acid transferase